jgi:hypothetical protein
VAAYIDALHVWEIAGRWAWYTAALPPAPDGPPDRPAELAVLDLGSGQTVWRRPIRVRWDAGTAGLAFTPDGRSLVVTHNRRDETVLRLIPHVQVWSTERGPDSDPLLDTPVPRSGGVPALRADVAFSPDGRQAAFPSESDLAVWDLTTGRLRHTLKGVGRYLLAMTFGPDGTRLFVVADREVVDDRRVVTELHVFDTKSAQLLLTLPLADDFAGGVAGMHFDGERLIVSRVTMYGSVEFQSFDGTPAAR